MLKETKLEKILYIPDTHSPFHDRKAWKLVNNVGQEFQPDIVNIQGDFWDCFTVSNYSKSPERGTSLLEEALVPNQMLDQIDSWGAKKKIYIEGNHEDRLQRFISDKAPELYGLVNVPQMLRLEERGWTFIKYKDHTKIGKVFSTHDTGSAGRFATYRALEAFQHSVVHGHTHRICYIVEGNAIGETLVAAQFGWLGDHKQIDYMQKVTANKNWPLGFGLGYMNPSNGLVYLVPVPIVKYTCVVEGKLFSA